MDVGYEVLFEKNCVIKYDKKLIHSDPNIHHLFVFEVSHDMLQKWIK